MITGSSIFKKGRKMEYSNIFKDGNGTEVEITVKTDCHTQNEMNAAISFMAQSARKFYLQLAEKINSTL